MNKAVAEERYPVPPEELRWRATGMRDLEAFLRSSKAEVEFLDQEALGRDRNSFKDFPTILDFGCGCGRLIRSLRPLCDQWASIHGTDVDAAAIAWCKENIPDASFSVNGENPPSPFEDKSIDLVLACSVFTHLEPEHQSRWLAELQRITRPGGYLMLTVRPMHMVDRIADDAARTQVWAELERSGVAFLQTETWQGAFPAWYGEAYHTPDFIRKSWGSYFEVCHIIADGTIPEETVVLRARESTFLQRLFKRP